MVKLTIRPDGRLDYKWTGRKGTGSLYQLAAKSNTRMVNALGLRELWCVLLAVRSAPFPMGDYEGVYKRVLAMWDEGKIDPPDIRNDAEKRQLTMFGIEPDKAPPEAMGRLRKYIVERAGDGCNAPTDSYLSAACKVVGVVSDE